MKIRKAKPNDINSIAKIHIETWRTAYRGIVPDDFLDNTLSIKRSSERIKESFDASNMPIFLVAESTNGKIVGFCRGGYNREKDKYPEYDGELMTIYVLKENQNMGIGISLVRAFCIELEKIGIRNMIIRTLQKSKYKSFYEKLGGKNVDTGTINIGGKELGLLTYGFPELPRK